MYHKKLNAKIGQEFNYITHYRQSEAASFILTYTKLLKQPLRGALRRAVLINHDVDLQEITA